MTADRNDRDELERRIAASLRHRADDVAPTPELWHRVETNVNRSKLWTVIAATAGAMAVIVAAAVAIPNLLPDDGKPSVGDDPTPNVTTSPHGNAAARVGDTVVVTDGARFWLADSRSGDELETLFWLNPDGEGSVQAFTVQPASTPDDVTVVWTNSAEGMLDLKWFHAVCKDDPEDVAKGLAASSGCSTLSGDVAPLGLDEGGEATNAAFSPDGSWLAYVGRRGSAADAPLALHVTAWDAEAALPAAAGQIQPTGAGPAGWRELSDVEHNATYRVESWTQDQVLVSGSDLTLRVYPVDTTGTEPAIGAPGAVEGRDVALIDIAGYLTSDEVVLTARGVDQGDAEFTIEHRGAVAYTEVQQTNAPGDAYLEVRGDGAIFGRVGDTTVIDLADGTTLADLSGAVYAAWLPTDRGADGPVPTPSPTETGPDTKASAPFTVVSDSDATYGLQLRDPQGALARQLFQIDFAPIGVAVRPGSTIDDLTVVFAMKGETEGDPADGGNVTLWTFRSVDGADPYPTAFPDQHWPASKDTSGTFAPVWDPTGSYLGWIDYNGPADCTLRVIGWDDGPGTGRTADDNASFGLDGCQEGATLESWKWSSDEPTRGVLGIAVRGEQQGGPPMAVGGIVIDRQPDGAVSLQRSDIGFDHEVAVIWQVAVADGLSLHHRQQERPLVFCCGGDGLDVPSGYRTDLGDGGWGAWIRGSSAGGVFGDGPDHLNGTGGHAWVFTADGVFTVLPGYILHADVVD